MLPRPTVLLLSFGLLVAPGLAGAQTLTDAERIRDELRSQGMSDEEILQAFEGLPLGLEPPAESVPSDIDEPAREIIDEGAGILEPAVVADSVGIPQVVAPLPSTSDEEVPLARFGDELFRLSPESFAPPIYGPIDPEYRLGPGDEVVIDVWGDTVFRVTRTVNREGNVLLPDVGQVSLLGLTLDAAKRRIEGQLSRAYSGFRGGRPTSFLDVSLGKLRPIKVFIVGEAARPGGYDLTAASTVFHALYAAGGPGPIGTMRDVRVLRGNRPIASLDVYDYLLEGDRAGDVRLQNDDTIFVPVRKKVAKVFGEVVRSAEYELVEEETLVDLMRMAGGVTARAHLGRVHLDRILPPEERTRNRGDRVVVDVDLQEVLAGRQVFELENLDQVYLLPISDERSNFVTLRGHVWRPGTYELKEGMRVFDLVTVGGGVKGDAFLDRAMIVRTNADLTRESITLDLRAALKRAPTEDVVLKRWDELHVNSRWDLYDREVVQLTGSVREPGEYELTDGMTLGDLLLIAGSFSEEAYRVSVEISRVFPEDPEESRIAETFEVDVGEDYLARDELPTFPLRNHDHVFVRRQPFWELQRNVLVEGQVLFPGSYTLRTPTERMTDVIARAGGLLETAFADGFQIERRKDDIGLISVDLRRALKDPRSDDNLVLLEGDVLRIPERPMTVKVRGAVGLPTSIVHKKGKGIGYYIDNAGGYLDVAKKGEVKVIYSTGRAAKVRRFRGDPTPDPGSEILVPFDLDDEGIDWGGTIKDITTILASLATTFLVIDRISE